MSDRPPLNVKWTLIGAAIIIGLNQILTLWLATSLYPSLAESMGPEAAIYVWAAIVAVGSFFVGGIIVGWLSPGETLTEPAIAAVIAIVINPLLRVALAGDTNINVVGLAIASVLGFGLGLAGAKVGEKLQGDTTDKMRERGELPPA